MESDSQVPKWLKSGCTVTHVFEQGLDRLLHERIAWGALQSQTIFTWIYAGRKRDEKNRSQAPHS